MATHDPIHDFDFLMGRWRLRHRRLKARLAGCAEWEDFDGESTAMPILGGHGNVDDNILDIPSGRYRAISIRTFDPKTRLWSIWWLDGRDPRRLDPPVVGSFENGVGTFLAEEEFEGKPIRVRFQWSRTDTASPHWEQAFSPDGGETWETNWMNDFTRLG